MVSSKCDTKQPLHKLLKTFLPLRLEIVGVDQPPVGTLYTRTLNLSQGYSFSLADRLVISDKLHHLKSGLNKDTRFTSNKLRIKQAHKIILKT